MSSIELTARRTVFAFGIALAALAAPAVAALAGSTAPQIVADPGCSSDTEPGEASLNCAPEPVPNAGAPGEMELTDTNVGVGSPSSPVHGGHH